MYSNLKSLCNFVYLPLGTVSTVGKVANTNPFANMGGAKPLLGSENVIWAYVGGVFGALGSRLPFPASDGGAGNIG